MEPITNIASFSGTVSEAPVFSHESYGKSFSRFSIAVPRLSGTVDILPVIAAQELLTVCCIHPGDEVRITGQIRSHNLRQCGKRHLIVFIYAGSVVSEHSEPENTVTLEGILCRAPRLRRTPLGREICDLLLAVPRSFGRCDYLPCILWGKTAREMSCCRLRDHIYLQGRMQSRAYSKLTPDGTFEKTAYEISAQTAQVLLYDSSEET